MSGETSDDPPRRRGWPYRRPRGAPKEARPLPAPPPPTVRAPVPVEDAEVQNVGLWYMPVSVAKPVEHGIKAMSEHGEFGETPWGKRWVKALEGALESGPMTRGRRYARIGQVTTLELSGGAINATVQGSQDEPYSVKVTRPKVNEAQTRAILKVLAERPGLRAQLLAGELPLDLEELFVQAGHRLLPERATDLQIDCTCADEASPCKHAAAVLYLISELIDKDPLSLLEFCGLPRDPWRAAQDEADSSQSIVRSTPLEADPDHFWGARPWNDSELAAEAPVQHAPLLRRLGPFPLWRGKTSLEEALEYVYLSISEIGREAFEGRLNEGEDSPDDEDGEDESLAA